MADRLGLNLSEIPDLLGISKAMLFAYRSGKNRITPKVWLKLERAEVAAGGKSPESAENAESSGDPKQADVGDSAHSVCEDSPPYRTRADNNWGADPDLLAVLERIASALESLAGMGQIEKKEPVRYSIKEDPK